VDLNIQLRVRYKMIVKVHKKENRTIVVAVDSDLIDKKFEEGDFELDLTKDFYKGEEMDDGQAGDIIRNADIVHLIGEQAIKLGVAEGVIEDENVKRIQGVPHAQGIAITD